METKTVRSGSLLGLVTSQAHLKPVVCLETSPPRDKADGRRILEIVARAQSRAEFVTVTDTGSSRGARAIEAAVQLRHVTGLPVIAHLACTGRTRDDLMRDVDALLKGDVDHVLVLRGDSFVATSDGFAYADEAIAFLCRRYPSLTIGAACYPSGHPEDGEPGQDIRSMQRKVRAGASFFASQLVFNHTAFRDHVLAAAKAGISVPILPGIPVVGELARLERITQRCRVQIPDELRRTDLADHVFRSAVGTARAAWVQGAPGIHLCTFNNPDLTDRFLRGLFDYKFGVAPSR